MWAPLMKWDMADPALVRKSTLFKVEKNATRLSPWNWPHFQWNRVDFMLFLEPLQAGSSPGVRQVNVQKCPSAVWLTPCDCFQKGQNMLSLLRVFCYPLSLPPSLSLSPFPQKGPCSNVFGLSWPLKTTWVVAKDTCILTLVSCP